MLARLPRPWCPTRLPVRCLDSSRRGRATREAPTHFSILVHLCAVGCDDSLQSRAPQARPLCRNFLALNEEPVSIQPEASVPNLDLRTRKQRKAARRLISLGDLALLVELPMLRCISRRCREERWPRVALRIDRIKELLGFAEPDKHAQKIRRALDLEAGELASGISRTASAGRTEHNLQVMKVLSPGGWTPSYALEGRDRLTTALARGRGAVLWVAHFCFSPLVTKMALAELGFAVSHVSRPEHGFSGTRFGIRYLNPTRCVAEARYLRQRIVFDSANPTAGLREAERTLRRNEIVSITAGAWEGRRVVRGPLLGGSLELATGAPSLALRTGAALLPVFTTRLPEGGGFRVSVGAELPLSGAGKSEALTAATAGFLAQLEAVIRAAPDQWRGWKYLTFAGQEQ